MPLDRNAQKQNSKKHNFLQIPQRFMSIPNMQNTIIPSQHPQKFQSFHHQLKSKMSLSKLFK